MKLNVDLCIIVHNGVNEIEAYLGKRGLNDVELRPMYKE